ncbi:hypothetical protein [Pseudomonas anguilliseptica]|uniref:Uncharacterized protein n=1 Tax=Pseudomonas anguilliseptica TaxID=53406 RepID=A0A1H4UT08_PSEAG|nr:hypothetical protein [Pseudomonas anguilliseptica]SEC71919.1 hypothetical protein SAMN05421553_1329 [Pseudomonas anguilliseptica]
MIAERAYSRFANEVAKIALGELLSSTHAPVQYQSTMKTLGRCLGDVLNDVIPGRDRCLVASTAEDADYLSSGVLESLQSKHETMAAIFWNNHYSLKSGSVAPIVHKYVQPGYEGADSLVVVKSVISGSCVVRTNILALIERLSVSKIYIVSPVMHIKSEEALRSEFPDEISSKFVFIYFAQDSQKDESGEVIPGIGGQIYQLLGIGKQPAQTGYMPSLVRRLAAI